MGGKMSQSAEALKMGQGIQGGKVCPKTEVGYRTNGNNMS
jgi:hypothetical protein